MKTPEPRQQIEQVQRSARESRTRVAKAVSCRTKADRGTFAGNPNLIRELEILHMTIGHELEFHSKFLEQTPDIT